MNNVNGAIEFEAVMKNDKLTEAINQAEKKIQGFADSAKKAGSEIDDTFDLTAENIRIQKEVIDALETDIQKLNAEIGKLEPGTAQAELQRQAAEAKAELDAERAALVQMEDAMATAEGKTQSIRARMKELTIELVNLEAAGKRDTAEFEAVRNELAQLTDAMGDARAQANILANDQAGFAGVLSAMNGISGALSAATGAVGMFAGENENLQKIEAKVQSAMAITIGLQQVSQALNKDSAFQLVVVANAKKALTAATNTLSAALGISTIAAKALMASLTLGLSVAITAVIALIDKMKTESEKAKKAQEEFNQKVADAAKEPLAAYMALKKEYTSLTGTMKDKEKWIKSNADKFNDLGFQVNNAKDAEDVLVKNTEAFVQSCIAKAKAMAAQQLAAEKYAEILKKQMEIDAMPDKVQQAVYTGSTPSGGAAGGYAQYDYKEVANPEKDKARQELKSMETAASNLIDQQVKYAQEAESYLQKIGHAASTIATGGRHGSGSGGGSTGDKVVDQFKANLDAIKSQYEQFSKWISSKDPIVREAAQEQFKGLLEQGASYIDYLTKQRDALLEITKRTGDQEKKLATLNNEIAAVTAQSLTDAFNRSLEEQLAKAETIQAKLDVIKQKREELKNDNSDVDNTNRESLDNAEKAVTDQALAGVGQLMEQYASFVERKRQLEVAFNNDIAALEIARSKATSEEEIARINDAIARRKRAFEATANKTGDADYDRMSEEYANFEEKKTRIAAEYAEKRQIAAEHGDQAMIEALNKAEQDALSEMALDEFIKSPDWKILFENLDDVTTSELERLKERINNLDGVYLGVKFNPEDLEKLNDKIDEVTEKIQKRNPFKSLVDGMKDFSNATDKESKKKALNNVFESASSACDILSAGIEGVSNVMAALGVEADSEAAVIMKDMTAIVDGAGTLAKGLATSNPIDIISGGVSMLTAVIDLFNTKDRKLQRQIDNWKKAIDALKESYAQLSWEIDRALGGSVYKTQKAAIANMKEQQRYLEQMWNAEIDKKKTDWDKVNEYKSQYNELTRQIQDMLDAITADILQTDAKSFANELGDALVEAFANGTDAAEAFGEVANNVLKNAVLNQLKKRFLEQGLQSALDNLENYMGYWNGDDFVFDGLSDAEKDAFNTQVGAVSKRFQEAMSAYEDLFGKMADDVEDPQGMSGSIQNVTEQTAGVIEGQMNAIRINQQESLDIIRQQLAYMAEIAANTAFNRFLESIYTELKNQNNSSSLRGVGLS